MYFEIRFSAEALSILLINELSVLETVYILKNHFKGLRHIIGIQLCRVNGFIKKFSNMSIKPKVKEIQISNVRRQRRIFDTYKQHTANAAKELHKKPKPYLDFRI